MIHETLRYTKGDKRLAAQLLGIATRTIYRRLETRTHPDDEVDEPDDDGEATREVNPSRIWSSGTSGWSARSRVACAFFAATSPSLPRGQGARRRPSPPKVTPIAPSVTAAATATRTKEGKPIADRNMFCSDCAPPVPVATAVDSDPSHIQLTSLPLVLIATSVGSAPEQSFDRS